MSTSSASSWDERAISLVRAKAGTGKPWLGSALSHSSLNALLLRPGGVYEGPEAGGPDLRVSIGAETSSRPIELHLPLFIHAPLAKLDAGACLSAAVETSTLCILDSRPSGLEDSLRRSAARWKPDRSCADLAALRSSGSAVLVPFDAEAASAGGQARFPGIGKDVDLMKAIDMLREATLHEAPVMVELPCRKPEDEVIDAINAGADAVVLADGGCDLVGGGGPNLHALVAVKDILAKVGDVETRVLTCGDFRSSLDAIRALALGADAVCMSQAFSHAIACEAIAGRGPTDESEPVHGASGLANFVAATGGEMAEILARMGKRSVSELSPDDLLAADYDTAAVTGLPLCGHNKKLAMWLH